MSSNIFSRLAPGTRSFYEELRARDDDEDVEQQAGATNLDEENLRHNFNEFDTEGLTAADSRITIDSAAYPAKDNRILHGAGPSRGRQGPSHHWPVDDEADNDVPASLLMEVNEAEPLKPIATQHARQSRPRHQAGARPSSARSRAQWEAATLQQRLHDDDINAPIPSSQPRSLLMGTSSGGPKQKAMWRWVNTSNLDSFMRDVYDYYEGGGLWCILCTNALWLL